ncbi:MAG: hypothetical protein WAK18_02395 [Nocardioidaceae bacterium]
MNLPALPTATGWRRWGPWAATAGMLVALWFYAFVALVAPWWVVPLMLLLWVALLVVAVRSFSRRPLVALLTPVAAMLAWFGIVSAGGAWWGWSA